MFAIDREQLRQHPYSYIFPITVSINGDFTNSENLDDFSLSPLTLITTLTLDFLMWMIIFVALIFSLGVFVVCYIPYLTFISCLKCAGLAYNYGNINKLD